MFACDERADVALALELIVALGLTGALGPGVTLRVAGGIVYVVVVLRALGSHFLTPQLSI